MTDHPPSDETPTSPPSIDRSLTHVDPEQAADVRRKREQIQATEGRRAVVSMAASIATFDGVCRRCSAAFRYQAPAFTLGDGRPRRAVQPTTVCKAPACVAADEAEAKAEREAEYAAMAARDEDARRREYVTWVPPIYHRLARLEAARSSHVLPELAEWDERLSLYLHGPSSSGKDHQLAALMHRVAGRVTMEWYSTRDLVADLQASYGDKSIARPSIFDDPCRPRVLVLSDMFAERATEHAATAIGNVIDKRYAQGLAVQVTSNVAPSEIEGRADESRRDAASVRLELRRIADRLIEMTAPGYGIRLKIDGVNWRHAIASREVPK